MGDKAWAQQAILQQIGDPFRIVDIGGVAKSAEVFENFPFAANHGRCMGNGEVAR
jgi:hypothetical protein